MQIGWFIFLCDLWYFYINEGANFMFSVVLFYEEFMIHPLRQGCWDDLPCEMLQNRSDFAAISLGKPREIMFHPINSFNV